MKTLLFFLMIGFYSCGQVPEGVEELPPPPEVTPLTPPPPVKNVVDKPNDFISDFPDVEAEFPCHTFYQYDTLGNVSAQTNECGISAMMQFLSENINYPETAVEMGEQGRVFLQFVIEKDGSITNVKVDRGVSVDLDNEAKRVLQRMPKWNPGQVNGRNVRSRCRIPINFRLG
jgi:TonB family protein